MASIRVYKDLQDEVLAWLDEAGDTATTLTLVKYALQAAHRKRVTEERWPFMLWDTPALLSIVTGQQLYTLHTEFFRPFYFWNRDQKVFVEQVDESSLLGSNADWNNDVDDALRLTLWGRTEVQAQPTSASVLALSSSSSTDNGTATLTVRGDTTQGVRSETITCNASGAVQFTKILKVTKNGVWAGTLTLTSNAGAVTNLVLFPEEVGRSFQQVFLLASPGEPQTIEYRFYRAASPLSADNDRTDLPPGFESILVYDALLALSVYNELNPNAVAEWRTKRDDLLLALRQSFTEQAEAIGSAANYTSYIPR